MSTDNVTQNAYCVDKKNYYLVFGYLNEAQQLLSSSTAIYLQIPQQIYFICLAYFETDMFAECGPNMTISDQGTVVKYTSSSYAWNTCFGQLRIESMSNGIHCWKFKILGCGSVGNVCIGIDGADDKDAFNNGYGFHFKTKNAYGFKCTGARFSGNSKDYQNSDGNSGISYKAGDCVSMKLDLTNNTLSYNINNEKEETFENIKNSKHIRYRIAVTTFVTGDAVSLLKYTNKYNKFLM
eukprot:538951_1